MQNIKLLDWVSELLKSKSLKLINEENYQKTHKARKQWHQY